jgi:hypothetical protein
MRTSINWVNKQGEVLSVSVPSELGIHITLIKLARDYQLVWVNA